MAVVVAVVVVVLVALECSCSYSCSDSLVRLLCLLCASVVCMLGERDVSMSNQRSVHNMKSIDTERNINIAASIWRQTVQAQQQRGENQEYDA